MVGAAAGGAPPEKLFDDVGQGILEAGLEGVALLGMGIVQLDLDKPIPHIEQDQLQSGRSLIPRYYSYGRPPLREWRRANHETFQIARHL